MGVMSIDQTTVISPQNGQTLAA